jgi:putative transposase
MPLKKHTLEEMIGKLLDAKIVLAQANRCHRLSISQQIYARWHKEYDGLRIDQTYRMKGLEPENARSHRVVSNLTPDSHVNSGQYLASELVYRTMSWAIAAFGT